jgi:hypothetical protein
MQYRDYIYVDYYENIVVLEQDRAKKALFLIVVIVDSPLLFMKTKFKY